MGNLKMKNININEINQIIKFFKNKNLISPFNEKYDEKIEKIISLLSFSKIEDLKNNKNLFKKYLFLFGIFLNNLLIAFLSAFIFVSIFPNIANFNIMMFLIMFIWVSATHRIIEIVTNFLLSTVYHFIYNKKDFISNVLNTDEIDEENKYFFLDQMKELSEKYPEKHLGQILRIIYNDLIQLKDQKRKEEVKIKKEKNKAQEMSKKLKYQMEIEKYI